MDLIRESMNKRRLANEKLHEEYRKMYKNHQFAYQYLMDLLNEYWRNQPNTLVVVGLAVLVMLVIYIKLLDIYQ